MPRPITPATSLDNLRKEAKRWLKALRDDDPEAVARFRTAHAAGPERPVLRDVQHALAREHGLDGWVALKQAVEAANPAATKAPRLLTVEQYERLAADFVLALDSRDEEALDRLNHHYARSFTFDDLFAEVWRRDYAFRQRSSRVPENYLALEEARVIVAQDAGFGSWDALKGAIESGAPPVAPFALDAEESRASPRRRLGADEWDALLAEMKHRRLTALDANGLMTDEVLKRVADLDHVTSLSLGGSRELSDDGLQHLARMPQLEHLDLSEYPGGKLTDRGLAVLRHLQSLRTFEMTWQRGITDAGVANLRACERLEKVNLMGSPTGDGAVEALQGKPNLRDFSTGKLLTDAGLRLLANYPMLKTWRGPPLSSDPDANPEGGAKLVIDGPFTDDGLASLAGLEGVFDLDLFWHATDITPNGFAHLVHLPNLGALGADGKLSGNEAMRHIAAMPRLRRLRIQESAATDDGFELLGRSRSITHIWGRECSHFASRAFVALSKMPALRGFGIGCKNVDDAALSTLPDFPALRELTPVGFQDAGFAHVGRCPKLQRLTCMYCRETTDAATEHIAALRLKYYYAGLTLITDRSLEILGRMDSLEQVELFECKGVTNAGLMHLAALPRLRGVELCTLPGVTLEGARAFSKHVKVKYWT
jgi:hypothetical protein